jgi:hypothetical protein
LPAWGGKAALDAAAARPRCGGWGEPIYGAAAGTVPRRSCVGA